MDELTRALLLGLLAGIAVPAGGALATFDAVHPGWLGSRSRHFIMALGAGALLAAVALVLVPDGSEVLGPWSAGAWFVVGGAAFALLDLVLERQGGSVAQLVAMLSDFLPESLALGAAMTRDGGSALLLAGLMALQNLPEGFNAQRELAQRSDSAKRPWLFAPVSLLGPAMAALGFFFLADAPVVLGSIMVFASGGITYLVMADLAPAAAMEHAHVPALGAVVGFAMGLIGHLLVVG